MLHQRFPASSKSLDLTNPNFQVYNAKEPSKLDEHEVDQCTVSIYTEDNCEGDKIAVIPYFEGLGACTVTAHEDNLLGARSVGIVCGKDELDRKGKFSHVKGSHVKGSHGKIDGFPYLGVEGPGHKHNDEHEGDHGPDGTPGSKHDARSAHHSEDNYEVRIDWHKFDRPGEHDEKELDDINTHHHGHETEVRVPWSELGKDREHDKRAAHHSEDKYEVRIDWHKFDRPGEHDAKKLDDINTHHHGDETEVRVDWSELGKHDKRAAHPPGVHHHHLGHKDKHVAPWDYEGSDKTSVKRTAQDFGVHHHEQGHEEKHQKPWDYDGGWKRAVEGDLETRVAHPPEVHHHGFDEPQHIKPWNYEDGWKRAVEGELEERAAHPPGVHHHGLNESPKHVKPWNYEDGWKRAVEGEQGETSIIPADPHHHADGRKQLFPEGWDE